MKSIITKAAAGALFGGSLMFTGGLGMASAAPVQVQDGLVNLALGDITVLEDVNVGVAAQVTALVCDGVDVGNVTALATAVDAGTDDQEVLCQSDAGPVTVTQNGPGNSENAPGRAENNNAPGNSENTPADSGTGDAENVPGTR
jgi:hypothetical protein